MASKRSQIEAFARLKPTLQSSLAQQILYNVDGKEQHLEVILPKDQR